MGLSHVYIWPIVFCRECILLEFLQTYRGINPLHFIFFSPIEFAASQMYLLSGGISTCILHKRNWKYTHSCVKYCYVVANWVQINSDAHAFCEIFLFVGVEISSLNHRELIWISNFEILLSDLPAIQNWIDLYLLLHN